LSRKEGSPRFIYLELHPYAWKDYGADLEKIKTLLRESGYGVEIPELCDSCQLEEIDYNWVLLASKKGI